MNKKLDYLKLYFYVLHITVCFLKTKNKKPEKGGIFKIIPDIVIHNKTRILSSCELTYHRIKGVTMYYSNEI